MKKIMLVVAGSAFLFAACNKDCKTGYTGKDCADQIVPGTITMNSVEVTSYAETKEDGGGWDISDGPDMYFEIYQNDSKIFTSNTVTDLAGASTLVYADGMPFNISSVQDNFTIKFFDDDDLFADELMGSFNVDFYMDGNGFPDVISLDNPDGSDFVFNIDVEYNF
ncbi:MAG: hypothetical protein H7X71_07015 [Chitinophagales bacterium]|nr:hypothetical protein [Chitinophagales bacterium]